ncbi:hypothetical protein [Prosthecochloris sp. GSB1]|uniref:hypothetical protein n=1 Tax=Prosthecochloris sp. GSB1 TaxID=281093 RepID=UPI00123749B4|nr:hypothetical protein [Prosthecochloris sp. GSB1]
MRGMTVPLPVVFLLVLLAAGSGAFVARLFSGAQDGGAPERDGGIHILGAFVTESSDLREGVSGRSRYYAPGSRSLYCYVKYAGAARRGETLDIVWMKNGEAFEQRSVRLAEPRGELLDSCSRDFDGGRYEVRLISGERLRGSVTFMVASEPFVRIAESSVVPGAVFPGGRVTVSVQYDLDGPDEGNGIAVSQRRFVKRDGLTVMEPVEREVKASRGANRDSIRFRLSEDAVPGEYEVVTVLRSNGAEDRVSEIFRVRERPVATYPEISGENGAGSGKKRRGGVTLDQLDRLLRSIYSK